MSDFRYLLLCLIHLGLQTLLPAFLLLAVEADEVIVRYPIPPGLVQLG